MLILKNGRLLTMAGPEFVGDIAVENGKIAAIGENLPAENAEVRDVSGCYVLPGIVDAHCHIGMWEDGMGSEGSDGNECTNPVTPELRAIDAINPYDRCFAEACAAGVTTCVTGPGSANVVGGQFVAVKTAGDSVEDMTLRFPVAMKAAFGENPKRVYGSSDKTPQTRMATAAILRKALLDAQEYGRKLEEAKDDPAKRPARDFGREALLSVVRRELPLKIHCHRADDILTAIRVAKEFNIRFTLDRRTRRWHHRGAASLRTQQNRTEKPFVCCAQGALRQRHRIRDDDGPSRDPGTIPARVRGARRTGRTAGGRGAPFHYDQCGAHRRH